MVRAKTEGQDLCHTDLFFGGGSFGQVIGSMLLVLGRVGSTESWGGGSSP